MQTHATEIRVHDGEFVMQMTQMRIWLDDRRFEPSTFRYSHIGGSVVIRVDFKIHDEAIAFAEEFRGRMLR